MGDLDEFEEDNIAKGIIWIKLHRKPFGNIWAWAEKIRTRQLANPDFKAPYEIWSQIYQLEGSLSGYLHTRNEITFPKSAISTLTILNANGF